MTTAAATTAVAPDVRPSPHARVLAVGERERRRLWAVCYRMTGNRAEADDLCQEALARAMERAEAIESDDPTGFLLRLTKRLCLDHLRHRKVERRVAELVDPVDLPDVTTDAASQNPERATILREDVRYAVVVALQRLTPRQRSALVLKDICDRSLEEVAVVLGTTENSAKALIHRARVALSEVRRHERVDIPADMTVVEQFANAIQEGSIERITELNRDHPRRIATLDVPMK